MVESLVALVVLSTGMLGIASLYVSSLKAERTAQLRTQAVNLVADMADRVRANVPAAGKYDLSGYGGTAPVKRDCVAKNGCSIDQLAEDDLARWVDLVKNGGGAGVPPLPGNPTPNVVYLAAAGVGQANRYVISVEWQEPGDGANSRYENTVEVIPGKP